MDAKIPSTTDATSILSSYTSPETPFSLPTAPSLEITEETTIQVPENRSEAIPISFPPEAVPYSYIGPISPSTKTIKVVHKDIAPYLTDAGVRGLVMTVSHGSYNGKPATLVVFSFSFRSGDHGFRFKNANIKIQFSKHPSSRPEDTNPAVVKFAPRKIYGLPTKEGRKNTVGGELSLQIPAGPLTVGPTAKLERESEWEQTHRNKTVGNFWSSKHGTDWDVVYWDMKENKRTKEGIPDRLIVGVVVEREGAFMATVDVVVDTPVLNGAFGSPWERRRPVAFVPGVEMGEGVRTRRFGELTEGDWRKLVPFEEWESVLVGERLNNMALRTLVPGAWPGGPHAVKDEDNDEDVSFGTVEVDIGEGKSDDRRRHIEC
ncbi:uncharacterized protein PAC_03972 [Phialocephala subalpina]|uniref:Uncharacterized protein n=1 Tax=Phialocephala subalpina TaxID=576137 RepID=A0A1L7WMT3_9HELO|nr:uncharacterized protein PAC_03972 [Phialocephala subalpina]